MMMKMMMRKLVTAALVAVLLVPHALAAGRAVAPRPLIPTGELLDDLAVASAGGRFLTVWEVGLGATQAIYGTISDADGRRISPAAFLIAEASRQGTSALEVVGTDDSFAVFFTDVARNVHMADVDLDGRVLGSRALALPSALELAAAWNGERFLVTLFRENQYINRTVAAFVARDGTILRADIALDRNAAPAHVAVTGDGFLVFATGRDFFAHLISGDGSVRQLVAGDPASHVISAPLGDGRLLVVYSMTDGQVRTSIWKDGAKLTEQTITVQRALRPVGLMPGNGRHLLVFATDALYAMHVDDDGTPVSEPVLVHSGGVTRTQGTSNGNVLFVAHQDGPMRPVVASVAIRADQSVAANAELSIRPAAQSRPLVGAGGGSMLAVWSEAVADDRQSRIRTAVINRDFETENVRELAPSGTLAVQNLAWNGTEYLVVYASPDERLYAARLAYDGDPIGEPTLLGEVTIPRAAAAWAGDRWAVAWTSGYGEDVVHYRTVSRSGVASPLRNLDVTGNLAFDVALAFDGSRVHLAWIETARPTYFEPPPSGHAVFTIRLRRNGHIVDAAPLAIPVTRPDELSMACNGEQVVLLVDQESRTTIHVISADSRQLVSTRTLVKERARSDVTWDGYEFVAAAGYRDGGQSFVEIWRLGDDARAVEDRRRAETLVRDPSVSVASSPAYDAVVGMQETDAASGPRAVIYAEREMFPSPEVP